MAVGLTQSERRGRRQRLCALLALVACLAALAFPVALAGAPGSGLTPICANGQIIYVDLGADHPGATEGAAERPVTCPLVTSGAVLAATAHIARRAEPAPLALSEHAKRPAPLRRDGAAQYLVRAPPSGHAA